MDSFELTEWLAWLDARQFREEQARERAEVEGHLESWVNDR